MRKKRVRLLASLVAAGMVLSGIPAMASEPEAGRHSAEASGEYQLVWEDEFDDELNLEDWNVEAHNPGWVNSELQRYVSEEDMEENIQVDSGTLHIYPTVEKKNNGTQTVDLFEGQGLSADGWDPLVYEDGGAAGTITIENGKAVVDVQNSGTAGWHVQISKSGMTLEEGHAYKLSFKAKSDVPKTLYYAIMNTSNWLAFRENTVTVGTEETSYSISVTMGASAEKNVAIQFNFGKFNTSTSGAARVEISDVVLEDLSAEPQTSGDDPFRLSNYNFTSGRINTQGKHDFKYGYFECRARVPRGSGYLPAFRLMASDEQNYGQWPQCGEIDIMEVMGKETNKSYHTIHYGYNSEDGHRSNQGTYVTAEGEDDFYADYHTYALEWLPDQLIWYVDGVEVYKTNDWYTEIDEEGHLTYPAPFDQDFYIILNLAVGGSRAGDPDEDTVKDMENQSFDIDYVRVYQIPTTDEWPFTDVKVNPGNWAYEGIKYVSEIGLMTGDKDDDGDGLTTFRPKDNINRYEFIVTLYRMVGSPNVASEYSPFEDVKLKEDGSKPYYYDAVLWAVENNITTGKNIDGTYLFKGKDEIKRQEIATMLMRYAEWKGYDTSMRAELSIFPDADKVSNYAKEAMSWACEAGLITGKDDKDGTKVLDPKANAQRREVAAILQRFSAFTN